LLDQGLHKLAEELNIVAWRRPKGHAKRRVASILPGITQAVWIDHSKTFAVGDLIEAQVGIHPVGGLQHSVKRDDDGPGLPICRKVDAIVPISTVNQERSLVVGSRRSYRENKCKDDKNREPRTSHVAVCPFTRYLHQQTYSQRMCRFSGTAWLRR